MPSLTDAASLLSISGVSGVIIGTAYLVRQFFLGRKEGKLTRPEVDAAILKNTDAAVQILTETYRSSLDITRAQLDEERQKRKRLEARVTELTQQIECMQRKIAELEGRAHGAT